MPYTNNQMVKSVYILRESPSEEPIAIFNDINDAYRYSSNRCIEYYQRAYITIKQYYIVEEEIKTGVRIVVWYDNLTNTTHTMTKYDLHGL